MRSADFRGMNICEAPRTQLAITRPIDGAGHYDYTLAHLRKAKAVIAIGIAFAAQEIEAVPALSHDVALDYVLTEKQAFDFRSS